MRTPSLWPMRWVADCSAEIRALSSTPSDNTVADGTVAPIPIGLKDGVPSTNVVDIAIPPSF